VEIVVSKSDLAKELGLVQGIVERKSAIPILGNVLVEAKDGRLSVSATDLEVSVRCGCEAQVVSEGALTLSARKLYEIVRALPEAEVHIKVEDGNWVSLVCERSTFRVAGQSRDDFPALPVAEASGPGLPSAVLADLIARTSFAITGEDARYYLAGALLVIEPDGLALVATDGHRLAYARREAPLSALTPQRVLVPRKAIHELVKLLSEHDSVAFHKTDNHLVFQAGHRTLASKMIEGQFPAFEKVVAVKADKKVVLRRDQMAATVRRVSLLASERGRAVKIAFSAGVVEVSASSPDLGQAREEIPVEYSGDPVSIGFNAQYVLDFLGATKSDEVTLELKDSDSQGMFRPQGDEGCDYRYVVMPMRF
jgi:DNA polymerase-3 subunit beta